MTYSKRIATLATIFLGSACQAGSADLLEGVFTANYSFVSNGVPDTHRSDFQSPVSAPSIASVNWQLSDGFVQGYLAFDSAFASSPLGGGVYINLSSGDPDSDSITGTGVTGHAVVEINGNMVFSYFALLQRGAVFMNTAVNAQIPYAPTGNIAPANGHFSGVGLPLHLERNGENKSVDNIFFSAGAGDNAPYPVGSQPLGGLFVNFKYYSRVLTPLPGDVDGDGIIDSDDITLQTLPDTAIDLTGDNIVDVNDVLYLVEDILDTRHGDFNLDGKVDFSDFLILQSNMGKNGAYKNGDANGDLIINFDDFLIFQSNYGWQR